MQDPQRLALRHQWNAARLGYGILANVFANRCGPALAEAIRLPAPYCPAILGSEHAFARNRSAPRRNRIHEISRWILHVQSAGPILKQPRRGTPDDGVSLFRRLASLQPVSQFAEQRDLIGALLQLLH